MGRTSRWSLAATASAFLGGMVLPASPTEPKRCRRQPQVSGAGAAVAKWLGYISSSVGLGGKS